MTFERWVYCADAHSYLLCESGDASAIIFNSHGQWFFYSRPYDFKSDGHPTVQAAKDAYAVMERMRATNRGFQGVAGHQLNPRGTNALKAMLSEAEKALQKN
jgi:hypothetical protein